MNHSLQFFTVSAANIHIIRKQFTTLLSMLLKIRKLFQLQIYTLFESNSQHPIKVPTNKKYCFSCKYTHYSKAIHNVFQYQFPTRILFQLQIYTLFESNSQRNTCVMKIRTNCFSCKYTHYSKAIHNESDIHCIRNGTVSAANIHIIRKQFTTILIQWLKTRDCFSCKYTHYSKAIHNYSLF